MWRVSERDERKEAQKTAGDLFVENKKLSEENARLKAPMKPVGEVFNPIPSPAISSSALIYYPQKLPHGAQLYAAPPAFLIAEAEARGRKEALLEAADVFDKQSNRELFCGTVADELRNMANKEE